MVSFFFGTNNDLNLFEWQAGRMRNYMTKLINDNKKSYKPRHYNPEDGKVITANHVAWYYSCLIAWMLSGNPLMIQMFSTCNVFDACEPIKQSMTLDCFEDIVRCLHFSDDWEDDVDKDWDTKFSDTKVEPLENTATHQKKFSMLEDAYNR